MSFVEFLLEYYIYILAVLIILIIGVIGFLVDSNNKDKKKKEDNSKAIQEANGGTLANSAMSNDVPLEPAQLQNSMTVNNMQNDMVEQIPQMANNNVMVDGVVNDNGGNELNNTMTNIEPTLNSSMPINNENGINNINQDNGINNGLNGQMINGAISQTIDTDFSMGISNSTGANSINNGVEHIQPVMPSSESNSSDSIVDGNSLISNANQNIGMNNSLNVQSLSESMNPSITVNSGADMLNSFSVANNMNNFGNVQSGISNGISGVQVSPVMGTPTSVNQNTIMNNISNGQMPMSSMDVNPIQMGQLTVNSNVNQVPVSDVNYNGNNLYNSNQMNNVQVMMEQNSINSYNSSPMNNMGINYNNQPQHINVYNTSSANTDMNQATMLNNGQNGVVAGMTGTQNTYSVPNVGNTNLQSNGQVVTSNGSQPFDISSMFLNNK